MMQLNENCELYDDKGRLWGVMEPYKLSDPDRETINKLLKEDPISVSGFKWEVRNTDQELSLVCVQHPNNFMSRDTKYRLKILGFNRLVMEDHLSLDKASYVINGLCTYLLNLLNK